jgi:hypothetical protein
MNNEFLLADLLSALENKNFEKAYTILKAMIKYDIISESYKSKSAMIVLYYEFLEKNNCYKELKEIYTKIHNRCVYYRNGSCYGQKFAPKTNCKGNRRKCEQ